MQGGKTDADSEHCSDALQDRTSAQVLLSLASLFGWLFCFVFIKYTVSLYPWLFWNLMCRPGWRGPEFTEILPASAFRVLE